MPQNFLRAQVHSKMVILLLISTIGISPVFGFINAGRSDTVGCLRGGVYYAEGAIVPSNERCQDCLCTAGEVTCTMKECRGARSNCRPVGFIKGTCCPLKFECDDEINQVIPEIPFSNSDVKTFRNTHSAKSCISRGLKYFSGQSVPVFNPCQSSCACVDGSIACTQETCPPPPPAFLRCSSKLEDSNDCCPTYNCPRIWEDGHEFLGCDYEGVSYEEGDFVANSDPCTDCYCLDGEVVCAFQECPEPPANNCRPVTSSYETCCPQKYECFNVSAEENDTSETPITTEDLSENMELTTTKEDLSSMNVGAVEDLSEDMKSTTTNEGLSSTDVGAVEDLSKNGESTTTNEDLSSTDVGAVEDLSKNIESTTTNEDLSSTGVGAVEDLSKNRESTTTNEDLSSTDVGAVEVISENMESTTTNEGLVSTDAGAVDVVTDSTQEVNEVTENNNEVAKEEQTTTVVKEVTEASVTTSDNLTTPASITTEDSTHEQSSSMTTVSLEDEFTTLAKIEEYTESTTELEQTTSTYVEYESTTTSKSDESPTEATPSTSSSITETTLGSSTDESTSDYYTTESSTDYYTVTEDMVTESTTITFEEMCSNGGNVYSDGESIPPVSQCQESCQCRNGTVTCIEKACSPAPPAFLRCASVEAMDNTDECCPSYNCPPVPPRPESPGCVKDDGIQYFEGEFVPSANLCTDCYCLYGEVVCAILECSPPVRDSCAPIYNDERACCPQYYECDIEGDVQTTTMYQTTQEPGEASTDISVF